MCIIHRDYNVYLESHGRDSYCPCLWITNQEILSCRMEIWARNLEHIFIDSEGRSGVEIDPTMWVLRERAPRVGFRKYKLFCRTPHRFREKCTTKSLQWFWLESDSDSCLSEIYTGRTHRFVYLETVLFEPSAVILAGKLSKHIFRMLETL